MNNPSTSSTENQFSTPNHDEVARRAYELWQQEGCPDGRAEYHWIEAERQILGLNQSLPLRATPVAHPAPTPVNDTTIRGAQLEDVDSPHTPFAEEAPLATRVQREISDVSVKSKRRTTAPASTD